MLSTKSKFSDVASGVNVVRGKKRAFPNINTIHSPKHACIDVIG